MYERNCIHTKATQNRYYDWITENYGIKYHVSSMDIYFDHIYIFEMNQIINNTCSTSKENFAVGQQSAADCSESLIVACRPGPYRRRAADSDNFHTSGSIRPHAINSDGSGYQLTSLNESQVATASLMGGKLFRKLADVFIVHILHMQN